MKQEYEVRARNATTAPSFLLLRFVSIFARIASYSSFRNIFGGSTMTLSPNTRLRLLIAAALIVGWIIVVFFRSGTAWG